jgi:hypothetical protein
MSEQAGRGRGSGPIKWALRQSWLWVTLVLVFLAAATYLLRLQRLSVVPPGLFQDEGANGLDALQVLQGHHAVFFPANHGREGLVVYGIAALIPLLGRTVLAVRLPTALASAGAVLACFWLGLVLFGDPDRRQGSAGWRRGFFIATAGAGLLAVSLGYNIIGRNAFRANYLPLLLAISMAALWSGFATRQAWRLVLAGVTTGLLAYTYIPARFVPLLLLLMGLSFLWPKPADGARLRSRLRSQLPGLILYMTVAALVAAPILIFFARHPEYLFSRSSALWVFDPAVSHGAPLRAFVQNVLAHVGVLGFVGDGNWRHNFDARPLLNPVESIFFWIGLLVACRNWRVPAYRLLVLWCFVLLLPAVLALDAPPNTLRMIGMAPAVYLLIGVGLWHTGRALGRSLQSRAGLAAGPAWVTCGLVMLLAGMVFFRGANTYRVYYALWANRPEVATTYNGEWPQLARTVSAEPADSGSVYLIPIAHQPDGELYTYGFRYLYQGKVPVHLLQAAEPDLARQMQQRLAEDAGNGSLRRVRVVRWLSGLNWSGDATGRLPFLLGKYGSYQATEESANYRILTYAAPALDSPWEFYRQMEPLAITYDGGISLQGAALGLHGGAQGSIHQPLAAPLGQPIWVVLDWGAQAAPKAAYRVSLRLRDASGQVAYQLDDDLLNFDHQGSDFWQPGEAAESLHILPIPATLAPGAYDLMLVVYNSQTLTPTVQVGTWQPELVLAHLELR